MIHTNTPTALAPLTVEEVDAIKALGGAIRYNLDGGRVITYPRSAVEHRLRELAAEMSY